MKIITMQPQHKLQVQKPASQLINHSVSLNTKWGLWASYRQQPSHWLCREFLLYQSPLIFHLYNYNVFCLYLIMFIFSMFSLMLTLKWSDISPPTQPAYGMYIYICQQGLEKQHFSPIYDLYAAEWTIKLTLICATWEKLFWQAW